MAKRRLCITVPPEIYEWLNTVSKQMGMDIDDAVTTMLYRYYEMWRLGKSHSESEYSGMQCEDKDGILICTD